jgi:prevent-host-death family protein
MTTVTFMSVLMPTTISKSKFKPAALEYFRRVQDTQEELIITDHGKPVLKIVPYQAAAKGKIDPLAKLRGTLKRYEQPFDPVPELWESAK